MLRLSRHSLGFVHTMQTSMGVSLLGRHALPKLQALNKKVCDLVHQRFIRGWSRVAVEHIPCHLKQTGLDSWVPSRAPLAIGSPLEKMTLPLADPNQSFLFSENTTPHRGYCFIYTGSAVIQLIYICVKSATTHIYWYCTYTTSL